MKSVFISGKITGDPDYKRKFEIMEYCIKSSGMIPLNPAVLPQGLRREQYMNITLKMLEQADFVIFLEDWRESEGAIEEFIHAYKLGKPMVTIEEVRM